MNLRAAILLAVALAIAGCKGGYDDTVLPGQREDAIPGQAVFPAPGEDRLPQGTAGGGTQSAEGAPEEIAVTPICPDPSNKNDPSCTTEDTATDGTFSDGQ